MNLSQYEIQVIQKIHQHITANFKNHILIVDLVKQYHLSETTITKGFKALYNQTIYKYRLQKCMEYAKSQIEQGVQIKNVQHELHYKSTGSFARAYKKIYGTPPTKNNLHQPQ